MVEHLPFKQRGTGSNPVRLIFKKEFVMNSRIFKNFDNDEIQKFLSHTQKNAYVKDTVIFNEKDSADTMYFIDSGSVEVFIIRKQKRIVLATLKAGDFFGEMAILRRENRSASIKAMEDCSILSLDRNTVIDIISQNGVLAAKFLFNLAEVIAERLTETNKEVENYFLISDALVENESFRKLYFKTHKN